MPMDFSFQFFIASYYHESYVEGKKRLFLEKSMRSRVGLEARLNATQNGLHILML